MVAAKTQPMNESKVNKKEDVTNYDIRNRKKRKFIICFWFQRVEKNPQRSVPALVV